MGVAPNSPKVSPPKNQTNKKPSTPKQKIDVKVYKVFLHHGKPQSDIIREEKPSRETELKISPKSYSGLLYFMKREGLYIQNSFLSQLPFMVFYGFFFCLFLDSTRWDCAECYSQLHVGRLLLMLLGDLVVLGINLRFLQ